MDILQRIPLPEDAAVIHEENRSKDDHELSLMHFTTDMPEKELRQMIVDHIDARGWPLREQSIDEEQLHFDRKGYKDFIQFEVFTASSNEYRLAIAVYHEGVNKEFRP